MTEQAQDVLAFIDQVRAALVAAKDADTRVAAASDRLSQLKTKTDAVTRQIAAKNEALAELDALIATRQADAAAARRALGDLRDQIVATEQRLKQMQESVGRQLGARLA